MAGLDFSKFKKNRKKLEKAVSKMKTDTPSYQDDRIWTPKQDKSGNAEAIFRFLPQQNIEVAPETKYFQHVFKERGQWFFENCPSTIEKDCPVCEFVKPLWDEDEDQAKKYNRGAQFVSNILVVRDPATPENEGKIMLFKYGFKIHEKIMDKTCPESDLDEAINVFDMWEGVNFKYKLKKVGGFNNYDSCEFQAKQGPIADDDDDIEKIYGQIYDLSEFTDEKSFKSYDAIDKKFKNVIGKTSKSSSQVKSDGNGTEKVEELNEDDDFDFDFDD